MGFHKTGQPEQQGQPPVEPKLRALMGTPVPGPYRFNKFQLIEGFSYTALPEWAGVDPHRQLTYDVKPHAAGKSTDLASIPTQLWAILGPYGRQLRPALLHDQLCDEAASATTKSEQLALRRAADDLFYEALRRPGSPDEASSSWFRARLFWLGVSLGRLKDHSCALVLLAGAHLLVGMAAIWFVLLSLVLSLVELLVPTFLAGLRPSPGFVLLVWIGGLLLSLLLTLAWRNLGFAGAVLFGILGGWFVAPTVALTFLTSLLGQFVLWFAELVTGGTPPFFGNTLDGGQDL